MYIRSIYELLIGINASKNSLTLLISLARQCIDNKSDVNGTKNRTKLFCELITIGDWTNIEEQFLGKTPPDGIDQI